MNTLELEQRQVKLLIKKAYEWRAKINKRHHRIEYFRAHHAIIRFKKFLKKSPEEKFKPNKTEILSIISWFLRCPAHNENEKQIFTLIGLVYKLHRANLENLTKKT